MLNQACVMYVTKQFILFVSIIIGRFEITDSINQDEVCGRASRWREWERIDAAAA